MEFENRQPVTEAKLIIKSLSMNKSIIGKRQDEPAADGSTQADVTTSSQTIGKPNVGSSASTLGRLIKIKQSKLLSITEIDEQIKNEIKKIIDWLIANNNLWSRTYTESYKYDMLTISDVDLENVRQYTSDVNKTFSIIKTKEGHIWGYYRVIQGNAMLWDSGNGQWFFNYEKGKYLTELNYELFFDFVKLYKSNKKKVLKKYDW